MPRVPIIVALALSSIIAPRPASAEPYRMMVNHGTGWSRAGDFPSPKQCEQEAAAYALKHRAQAGCSPLRVALQWEDDVRFQTIANRCAVDAGVDIVLKPGQKLTILGNTQRRFAFDRCMAESGHAVEGKR